MKKLPFLIIVLLFLSACGNTKKVIENTTPKENDIEIQSEIPLLIKEDIGIQDGNSSLTLMDIIVVEKEPFKEEKTLDFDENRKKNSADKHKLLTDLLQKHVAENGNVNYQGFKKNSSELQSYISILKDLYPNIDNLSREETLAYWINAYNALTIDLVLRNYPLKSIKDIKGPWDQRLWKFGDKWMSLNQIEHDILRKMDEPRIHFAIVCASVSCPKLQNKAFEADTLDTQLTAATKEFLEDPNRNEITETNIKISKLFRWFAKDFKTNGSIIDFLNQYSDIEISEKAKTSYKDYDWGLNE